MDRIRSCRVCSSPCEPEAGDRSGNSFLGLGRAVLRSPSLRTMTCRREVADVVHRLELRGLDGRGERCAGRLLALAILMRSAFEFDRLLGMLPDVSRYGVRFARDVLDFSAMELESVAISLARRAMRFALIADAHEAAAASAATMAIQSLRSNPSGMSGATRAAAPAQRRRGPGQRGCGGQHRQPEELRGTPPPPLRRPRPESHGASARLVHSADPRRTGPLPVG